MKWEEICKPTDEFGLGIRDSEEFNIAGMMKLAWDFLKNSKLWCGFMKARFCSHGISTRYHNYSSVWQRIKEGIQILLPDIMYLPGRNSKCMFWKDIWLNGKIVLEEMAKPQSL